MSWDPDRMIARHLPPGQPLTGDAFAEYILPRFDTIVEDLPRLPEVPSAEHVLRLGHLAGVPLLLGQAPDMRTIAAYTHESTQANPEIQVTAYGNGATLLLIGEDRDRHILSPLFSCMLDYATEALHTHPDLLPDSEEDPVMAFLPSPADLDITSTALRRAGSFIASSQGLLFHGNTRLGNVDHHSRVEDFVWERYPLLASARDLSPQDFALAYLDFLDTATDIAHLAWPKVSADLKFGELASAFVAR